MALDPALTTVAANVVEKITPALMAKISQAVGRTVDKIRVEYTLTFQDHLAKTLDRVRKVKTLIARDAPVPLESIYVSLRLKSDEVECLDQDIIPVLGFPVRYFIYGTGGAGKTMLLKHLLLTSIQQPSGLVPIFCEFRGLAIEEHASLESAIFAQIVREGSPENYNLFIEGLRAGVFVIYLDGLDEISQSAREKAIIELQGFSSRLPVTSLIVSSRPGLSAQSLEQFKAFRVVGLSLEQAKEVIEKTDVDDEIKSEFIKRLELDLYNKHRDFLEIPLLVIMMLLTYGSYADIPERMTVFYEQAFETLYSLHDTTSKGLYKRPHFAALSPDNFRRMFETFCYITLAKARFEFIYSDLIDYLQQALRLCQIESDASLVLKDLEESVCLIHQEGIKYVFAHRSFQEYFSAKFALRYGGANQYQIINNCIGKHWSNNSTIKMMNEIDEVKFREKWLLPALERVVQKLEETKLKPIAARLAIIASELHFDITANGNVGPISIAANEEQLSLFMNVSKACSIKNPLQAIHGRSVVPVGYNSIAEFAESGEAPESLVGSTLRESDQVIDNNYSLGIIRLDQGQTDLDWLDRTDLVKCFDEFDEQVQNMLDVVKKKVEAQKVLELEVL